MMIPVIAGAELDDGISGMFVDGEPILNFKLPVFGDAGTRKMYFQGKEGVFEGKEKLHVKGMVLKIFDEKAPYGLEMAVYSEKAMVVLDTEDVYSDEKLEVESPRFILKGEKWHWNGREKKMVIEKNVKIDFKLSLESLIE